MLTRRTAVALVRWSLTVTLLVATPVWADTAFVDGFDDLPLMPGLSQESGRAVQFDSPYGRIIESWATGNQKIEAVVEFYENTLPHLGWIADSSDHYHRDSDVLVLDIHRKGSGVEVHFSDSPVQKTP